MASGGNRRRAREFDGRFGLSFFDRRHFGRDAGRQTFHSQIDLVVKAVGTRQLDPQVARSSRLHERHNRRGGRQLKERWKDWPDTERKRSVENGRRKWQAAQRGTHRHQRAGGAAEFVRADFRLSHDLHQRHLAGGEGRTDGRVQRRVGLTLGNDIVPQRGAVGRAFERQRDRAVVVAARGGHFDDEDAILRRVDLFGRGGQ